MVQGLGFRVYLGFRVQGLVCFGRRRTVPRTKAARTTPHAAFSDRYPAGIGKYGLFTLKREKIIIELMTSHRKVEVSREGSK